MELWKSYSSAIEDKSAGNSTDGKIYKFCAAGDTIYFCIDRNKCGNAILMSDLNALLNF